MLRKLYINQKKIPVPVPLRSLGEAIQWIESTLLPNGHTITRVLINEIMIDLESVRQSNRQSLISDDTRVDVQIDSPLDLATQTLDALRNLGLVVASGLKMLAYECWKGRTTFRSKEIDACLLYTSPSPRDRQKSRMPSSA